MAKDRSTVEVYGRAAFYALMYDRLKEAALDLGYALAIHGSLHRDFDLIAVPWVKDAEKPEKLIQAFIDLMGDTIYKQPDINPTPQPHGRTSHVLSWGPGWYIDLSIMNLH